MKIVTYTLNQDGTIPEFIVRGGYFPVQNNMESPQDFNLVGITNEDISNDVFENVEELIEYVNQNNFVFINPETNESISNDKIVGAIWDDFISAITN